jgi:hypothetical protein
MISGSDFWDAALTFADGQQGSEFLRRTGAGRLFYAAFHDVSSAIGYGPQGEGSHLDLVNRARGSAEKNIRNLARNLDQLRLKRQIADYRLTVEFTKVDLDDLCRCARKIRNEMLKWRVPTPPPGPPEPKPDAALEKFSNGLKT